MLKLTILFIGFCLFSCGNIKDTKEYKELTKMSCRRCGGTGYVFDSERRKVVCEDVWHDEHQTKREKDLTAKEEELLDTLDNIVPQALYRDSDFDEDALWSSIDFPEDVKTYDSSLKEYCETLSNIIRYCKEERKLPKNSYYIHSYEDMGKKYFAYTLLKICHLNGYKVRNIMNIAEITDKVLHGEFSDLYAKVDDLDLIVVTLNGIKAIHVMYGLDWLVTHCEQNNIPLIVLSRSGYTKFLRSVDNTNFLLDKPRVVTKALRGEYGKLVDVGFSDMLGLKMKNYLEKTTGIVDKRSKTYYPKKNYSNNYSGYKNESKGAYPIPNNQNYGLGDI